MMMPVRHLPGKQKTYSQCEWPSGVESGKEVTSENKTALCRIRRGNQARGRPLSHFANLYPLLTESNFAELSNPRNLRHEPFIVRQSDRVFMHSQHCTGSVTKHVQCLITCAVAWRVLVVLNLNTCCHRACGFVFKQHVP